MRALIIIAPALMLGACQVTEDKGNGQTTVSYNQDVAENAGANVVNAANEAASAISNDAKKAGDTVSNLDVDVSVGAPDSAALLHTLQVWSELGWIRRLNSTRALDITPIGRQGFAEWFGLDLFRPQDAVSA